MRHSQVTKLTVKNASRLSQEIALAQGEFPRWSCIGERSRYELTCGRPALGASALGVEYSDHGTFNPGVKSISVIVAG